MNSRSFFSELKRRNVYKVAAAYAVVGWLLIQIATQVFPFFEIPNWAVRLVVLAIVVGFPIALVMAWAFELTPEGLKRTEAADAADLRSRNRIWIYVVIIAGLLSVGLFFLGRYSALHSFGTGQRSGLPVPQKSIAVLPFENLSRDPDNAYFTEGIQEEILTRLAKVADLKVISRTSTQRFQSSPEDLLQIAQRLGVAHILEGSVQRSQGHVRVNVQLINATTDSHLWAESFDRKLNDIFAVESEIATKVADTLKAKLSGPEQTALAVRPTENDEAHQLYLLGRYFWNKRSANDFRKAIGYFQQAIDKDPAFAPAYAGIADTYVLLSGFAAASPKESLPKAKAAAEKALELNGDLGEAHAALGQALFAYDFDIAESNREFRRAIELNPNYATAHQWYAEDGLTVEGRFDEAIEEMKRAFQLDPLSVIINADVGSVLFNARRYDESIKQLRKAVEMDPAFYYARWTLGEALEMKGMTKEAMAQYEKAIALNQDDPLPLALKGRLCGLTGRREEALRILKRLQTWSTGEYVSPYNSALVYLGLGQKEEAINLLERTYDDRDGYNIAFIKTDPFLDPLRGHPRFEALVQKIFPSNAGSESPSTSVNSGR